MRILAPLGLGALGGVALFVVAFVAFMRGWLGVDGLLIDTLHHF